MATARRFIVTGLFLALSVGANAQKSAGPAAGTLIIDGGGVTKPVVHRFVELAGGRAA